MFRLFICLAMLTVFSAQAAGSSLAELRSLVDRQQYADAARVGESLLQNTPADSETLFLTAYSMQMQNQWQQASTLYRKMISLYPGLPEPRNNLAIILLQQDNYQEAANLLVEALNTHPSYATSYRNLNEIYKGIASRAYQRAVSEEDKLPSVANAIQLDRISQLQPVNPQIQLAAIDSTPTATSETTSVAVAVVEEAVVEAPPEPDSAAVETEVAAPPVVETVATTVATEQPDSSEVIESGTANPPLVTAAVSPPVTQSETLTKNEPTPDIDKILEQRVMDWAAAWSSKSFAEYIAFYPGDYSPRFETHQAWVEHRRKRIMRPGDIKVEISKINIRARSENRVVIDFEQDYQSTNYSDRVIKRIVMGRFDKQWKITAERVLSVL